MSWTFDVESQSLYVKLSDGEISRQVEMTDGTIVDVDEADNAVGVEVLRAWAPWDVRAVVSRFNLSEDTAKFLEVLARTVATMTPRPTTGEPPMLRELIREQPASSANALEMATA
jgi:uncharacterized protein YuzE